MNWEKKNLAPCVKNQKKRNLFLLTHLYRSLISNHPHTASSLWFLNLISLRQVFVLDVEYILRGKCKKKQIHFLFKNEIVGRFIRRDSLVRFVNMLKNLDLYELGHEVPPFLREESPRPALFSSEPITHPA